MENPSVVSSRAQHGNLVRKEAPLEERQTPPLQEGKVEGNLPALSVLFPTFLQGALLEALSPACPPLSIFTSYGVTGDVARGVQTYVHITSIWAQMESRAKATYECVFSFVSATSSCDKNTSRKIPMTSMFLDQSNNWPYTA